MTRAVCVDFVAPGGPNRFAGHLALEPPAEAVPDVGRYLDVLAAGVPAPGPVVLVTYCLTLGLAGGLVERLAARGIDVVRVVGIDPEWPTPARVVQAYREVLAQVPGAPAITADELGGPDLAAAADRLSRPLAGWIRAGLGLGPDGDDDIVDDLLGRYRVWLRHVLACRAAASVPIRAPVVVLASQGHPLDDLPPSVRADVRRCDGDALDPAYLAAVLDEG